MGMAPEKTIDGTWRELFRELTQVGLYKRSQGRVTRQVTCAVLWLTVLLGAWRLSVYSQGSGPAWVYLVPGLVIAVGLWVAYRVVNFPRFADFLIAVEAEMAKVSWPTRSELLRSSLVVIVSLLALGTILFAFDLLWQQLLRLLGVLV